MWRNIGTFLFWTIIGMIVGGVLLAALFLNI